MVAASRRANSSVPQGYIEDKSKGAMLRFQDSLPRLPVPTLEETASRYIKTLQPLLTTQELEASRLAVEDFIKPGGQGEALQQRLLAKRADPAVKNWLYEWWTDTAYLSYRDPVIPYVSYFYAHRDDRKRRDPARRAAAITTAALEFKRLVDTGELEPEYMQKRPICMDSYKWMFNASRVPARPADHPVKYPAGESTNHIVVLRRDRLFKVRHEVGGRQLSTAELEAQFRKVYELAGREPREAAAQVGILTTENRDVWTDGRAALLAASPINIDILKAVESASFLVCLDDAAPVTLEERAHQFWHGNGGTNRWFDKPVQFIVADNGTSGFCGEHSMMDGTPTHRLNDFVCDVILNERLPDLTTAAHAAPVRSHLPDPEALVWVTDADVAARIDAAKRGFATTMARHELTVQAFQGYGKGLIKKFRCSPDAYVQMIIQLAYHKMHGKNRPTYESAATRRFQLGRTETCRSLSAASAAWCASMAEPPADGEAAKLEQQNRRVDLFRASIASHLEYITAALDGKGVDRHLFGLRKLLRDGEPTPAIYADPAFGYSSTWFLSTSQLSSEFFNGYGWSQVVDQGYGIAYMINENSINFNIVSKGMGSARMGFFLNEAAGDMRDLLMPTIDAPKAKL